ncbi:MAG: long-chain fatty acid--CoA ligase [Alphaproteobacteria bacterium]|nr:long-chain fatty acid--CoA ligase [Alphaproteobacteria bacterium]
MAIALSESSTVPTAANDAAGSTVPQLFARALTTWSGRTALREKTKGIWRSVTWQEYGEHVRWVGLGLAALGLKPGERVAILANNGVEWVEADIGAIGAGGVSVGIYVTSVARQVAYIVNDAAARFIFVEDEEQLDKMLEVRADTPSIEKIIVFDMEGLREFRDPQVLSFAELLALGREQDTKHPERWAQLNAIPRPDDLAVLIYTSGTTGPPKGAMISHRNIVYQMTHVTDAYPVNDTDNHLSFLPACHVFERLFGVWLSIGHGMVVNFAEDGETVPENLREVQPTIFAAVPRVWEKFYSSITLAVRDASALQRWAYKLALAVAYRAADAELAGKQPNVGLRLARWVAYWTVLRTVRQMIGIDRCRTCLSSAAPISPELLRWFRALGINMVEGYGMTEATGGITINPFDRYRLGSVGKALPESEVRVSRDGEILVRGPHIFMGYLNKPDRTAEALKDGWLHTGDVGSIDADGYVKITDRLKDIIITAGGKNITPSEIENELKFSPYISDAVVIGDGRKFLSCLVMIDADNVARFAQDNAIPFTNYASLTQAPEVVALIQREIDAVNKKFARVESIRSFRLIDRLLTPEDEELTPTLKLKRAFVNKRYGDLIESMYRAA